MCHQTVSTRYKNMNLSLRHLQQYQKIAGLLWRYGRSDVVKGMGIGDDAEVAALTASYSGDASPTELADDLEAMGPTYVKLGQVLASRPDILPPAYINALSRLHDGVKPFSFAEVEEIVTTEWGVRLSKAFSHFEQTPLAAASLGQAHSATLRDGRRVVVKIQHPGIDQQIAENIRPQMSQVDVVSKLEQLASANSEKLNWKVSIVDLMKLLDMDSSLASRKDLAIELGYPRDQTDDSAQMNMWLHKTVLRKLSENGGNIPQELLG